MRWKSISKASTALLFWPACTAAFNNYSDPEAVSPIFSTWDDRPPECPPCFNCQLEAHQCLQYAPCDKYTGNCVCPPGFGGTDCSQPECGSLAQGANRGLREDKYCSCEDGWGGINCNVCKRDDVCNAMMPEGEGGVCFKQGITVKQNFQMCDVTNRKILDLLKERTPQATFTCKAEDDTCNFQCAFAVFFFFFFLLDVFSG